MASALIQHKAVIPETSPKIEPEEAISRPRTGGLSCPFCYQPISAMASRCEACHLPLVVDCPACDARLDVEWPVCTECGYELGNYRHKTVYFAHLATAYHERKKYRQAMDTWKMVEKLSPKYPNLYLRLAEAQAATGHAQVAIVTLRQVLAADPGQEAASLVLAQIYDDLGHRDDAKAVYNRALAVTPQSAELHFALGWLLLNHNHLERALPHLQEAVKCNPQHGLAWFRLGQLYQMYQQPKLAAEAGRKAIALLPPDALAYQEALRLVNVVKPELPRMMSTGWLEFVRQMTGPVSICLLATLLDSGLRPWWIPFTGWLALLLGLIGSLLWVSGASLPINPVICWLVGERGLFHPQARTTATVVGVVFWLLAMGLILAPIGQSSPEVPSWILNS
jgi:tetratricopeptide (TPR) repeat protein